MTKDEVRLKHNEYHRLWRKDHAESVRETMHRYYIKNQDKRKAYDNSPERVLERRRQHLARRYNVTPEAYEALLVQQNNLCAMCRGTLTKAKGKMPHTDHDHLTGEVRGILCAGCNHGLGYIEKEGFVEMARDYLDSHNMLSLIGKGK
jgi:Recombination endonuclease VII